MPSSGVTYRPTTVQTTISLLDSLTFRDLESTNPPTFLTCDFHMLQFSKGLQTDPNQEGLRKSIEEWLLVHAHALWTSLNKC